MKRIHRHNESGQVLAEYSIMLVMTVMIALMLVLFTGLFMEYGWRIIELVAWEP